MVPLAFATAKEVSEPTDSARGRDLLGRRGRRHWLRDGRTAGSRRHARHEALQQGLLLLLGVTQPLVHFLAHLVVVDNVLLNGILHFAQVVVDLNKGVFHEVHDRLVPLIHLGLESIQRTRKRIHSVLPDLAAIVECLNLVAGGLVKGNQGIPVRFRSVRVLRFTIRRFRLVRLNRTVVVGVVL